MSNYKLTIKYDGTNFYGWQSQKDGNTIQDEIINAIKKISQENINLIGAGRTDAGVHALGQVANFNLTKNVRLFKFRHSLNSVLPSAISISKMEICDENFNSRFDAKKRSYIYLISKNKNPFYEKYSYKYPHIKKIDLNSLNLISKIFIGEKDFTSFCKANTDTNNKICNVFNTRWKETKDFYLFKIEANRFLHGMVRTIVGTILNSVLHEEDQNYIGEVIRKKNRTFAAESVPAKGLFLSKVEY